MISENKDSLFIYCGLETTSTILSVKQCSRCKQVKPLSEFHKKKRETDGFQPYCKQCNLEAVIQWNKDNPDARLLRDYNITLAQKQQMIVDQNGGCAICGKLLQTGLDQNVDHCHDSIVVRGILCQACNLGLGHFKDSIQSLQQAIYYLNYHAKKIAASLLSTGNYPQGQDDSEHGPLFATRSGQDDNDPDHHSGTIQGQDADHRAQASSGDSVGHRSKEVEPFIPITRLKNNGQPDAEIIRLEFGRRDLFD